MALDGELARPLCHVGHLGPVGFVSAGGVHKHLSILGLVDTAALREKTSRDSFHLLMIYIFL